MLADQPTFDFESGDLQGWQVTEGQFGRLVCDRATFHNTGQPYNRQGTYYLSTLETVGYTPDDRFTGELRSPTFVLVTERLCFLVGGGRGAGVYVALCLADDDEAVRAARGDNDETMRRHIWDTAAFVGKRVYLRLVDQETGSWGHITFDDLRPPTEAELAAITADASPPAATPTAQLRAEVERRLQALRSALDDLHLTYGDDFPQAETFLGRVDDLRARLEGTPTSGARKALLELFTQTQALARKAYVTSPLLRGQVLVYVSRDQYPQDHHNTETMFQNGAIHGGFRGGGALKLLDLASGTEKVLVNAPQGMVRDPEVDFDGHRIVFSYRTDPSDDYHIWEIKADGSGLRQLTTGARISDIDPLVLPSGEIVFASTRDPKLCACNVHAQANLFKMDADGSRIRQLGRNPLFEGHPSLMPDGRILYDRWEYVDKHWGPAQGLWTCYPDGTGHALYYHNNAWWPGAVIDGRSVPGTDRVICTLGSCHAPPFGELALIDRRLGLEGVTPIIKSWPQVAVSRNGFDHVWGLPLRYEDPYPLTDRHFLCARTLDGPEGPGSPARLDRYGIYLLDLFGNEVLLHEDAERSCFDPLPLAPRSRPPVLPARNDYSRTEGLFLVVNVYQGTGMGMLPPGSVKWLRIVESPPKRGVSSGDWNNGGRQAPAMNWSDVGNKRIIGRVPVASDGSAYFRAPADTFVFFQLLDENGMMLHSMRSGTMVQPGEMLSCAGCHEERTTVVSGGRRPRALQSPPAEPEPWYGPPREFNYATEVQPVFDRYCVSCHDYGRRAGRVLNLCGDKTLLFNVSYLELHRRSGTSFVLDPPEAHKPLIKVVNLGPPEVLPPLSWGSHRSALVDVLWGDHHGVRVDAESRDRVITWVDMNAPYYGSYACTRPDNLGGRCPLTPQQIARLNELTGVNVADEVAATWVNLTRPELSPCLTVNLPETAGGTAQPGKERFAGLEDPGYQEALAIIQAGAADLIAHPRMDMPGAVASEACRRLEQEAQARRREEAAARMSLATP